MISHYLLVALGGALGAVTRLGLGRLIPDTLWHIPFPILLTNILGCFLCRRLRGTYLGGGASRVASPVLLQRTIVNAQDMAHGRLCGCGR